MAVVPIAVALIGVALSRIIKLPEANTEAEALA